MLDSLFSQCKRAGYQHLNGIPVGVIVGVKTFTPDLKIRGVEGPDLPGFAKYSD